MRYGNYHQQLLPFIEVFGIENVIIVDGSNMGNEEAGYIEERFNLDRELHFEFNTQKKFNCLTQPQVYTNRKKVKKCSELLSIRRKGQTIDHQ